MLRLPENVYERESKELLTVAVQKNKNLVTEGIFLSVINSNLRPVESDWVPAIVTVDNQCGFLIDNLPIGTYSVWVRVINSPEDAIFRVGIVRII